jgi:hypothetical protein
LFRFDIRFAVEENNVRVRKTEIQLGEEELMTKAMVVAVLSVCLSFAAGIAVADKVHDWHDLDAVHKHVQEAIRELDHARAANHYDMAGHGAKAEGHLHEAERELNEAIEAIRAEH